MTTKMKIGFCKLRDKCREIGTHKLVTRALLIFIFADALFIAGALTALAALGAI